jgi:hypothetical protein
MEDEKLSGKESLEIIQSMINKARNQFGENGHLYLLWGWVVLFCSMAEFLLLHFYDYPKHYLVWMLTWLAFIYQVIYVYRNKKREKVKTYTGDILGYVWLVFVILMLMTTILFSVLAQSKTQALINPFILSLYGMPTFLSGKILRFNPLVIGGICCWLLALIAAFMPYDIQILFFGLSVIIAWIIPGSLLRKRFQIENP